MYNQASREAITCKLVTMTEYLQELKGYLPPDVTTHTASRSSQRLVERMAQLVIECAADINELLLEMAGQPPSGSARESFAKMQALGIIDEYLAHRFQQTYVGLRNRIIHDYERLDARVIYHTAGRLLEDGAAYIRAITAYTEQGEAS